MDKEKVTEELVRQNGNQAAAVMADYAGQGGGGGGGSVPKLSDFAILEPLTLEETELWEAANGGKKVSDGSKLNKKVLEKLVALSFDEENGASWYTVCVDKITELDDAGNILAILLNAEYRAKNSSAWEGTIVPDSASDDYFYRVTFVAPVAPT